MSGPAIETIIRDRMPAAIELDHVLRLVGPRPRTRTDVRHFTRQHFNGEFAPAQACLPSRAALVTEASQVWVARYAIQPSVHGRDEARVTIVSASVVQYHASPCCLNPS